MLKFKKALAFFVSLILIFSLTACSDVDLNYGVVSQNRSAENEVEKSNYDEDMKIMSSDKVMPKYFDISLFDEENYADIYLGKKFQINAVFKGMTIPVPANVEELKKLGWKFAEGNEYDEKSLVFAYETIEVVFQTEDGVKVKTQFYNSSRSSKELAECNVVKFRIENDFYKNNKDYSPFNINGITNTMAVTDVINTLGTPSHFYEISEKSYYLDYFITKKDRRNGITVYVNPVDDIVTAVEFSYYK